MNLLNVKQLNQVEDLDLKVKEHAERILEILDVEYGFERKLTEGGYVMLINEQHPQDVKELEKFIELYSQCIVEYAESFIGGNGIEYWELLFLLSDDYGVSIFMTNELLNEYKDSLRWD